MEKQPENLTEESLRRAWRDAKARLERRSPELVAAEEKELIAKRRAALTAISSLAVIAAHSEDSAGYD